MIINSWFSDYTAHGDIFRVSHTELFYYFFNQNTANPVIEKNKLKYINERIGERSGYMKRIKILTDHALIHVYNKTRFPLSKSNMKKVYA